MNHFQKRLSLLLALLLMLTAFSACGQKAEPEATEAAPAQTTVAVMTETEAPAQEPAADDHYHVGNKIEDFFISIIFKKIRAISGHTEKLSV